MNKVSTLDGLVYKISSNLKISSLKISGRYPVYGATGVVGFLDTFQTDEVSIALIKDGAGVGRPQIIPAKSSVIGTMQLLKPKSNVDITYLFYLLKYFDLGKAFNGATIPHIYFKDYKNKSTRLVSFEEQKNIGLYLSTINDAIISKQKDIQRLNFLIKSRFIEMFGDPDENPFNWDIVTINDVCSSIVRGPFGSALKKEFFVDKSDSTVKVYEQQHPIKKNASLGTYYITLEKYKSLKRFECVAGDILMSCSGTMGELYQLPQGCEKGIINQALCKFTLNNKMLPRVFLESMKYVVEQIDKKGSGIQNIAAVSYVKAMKLCLPPIDIQKVFVGFYELIDKSKFVIQQQIKVLQELLEKKMDEYFGGNL